MNKTNQKTQTEQLVFAAIHKAALLWYTAGEQHESLLYSQIKQVADEVNNLSKQSNLTLLNAIRERVIGEDEKYDPRTSPALYTRNNLRAEQRKILSEIEAEI